MLFSFCGGALGVLSATWGVDAIVASAPADLTFQATSPIEIDGRVLTVTLVMTLLTGLVFGLLPALRGSRPDLDVILKATPGGGGGQSYSRFAGMLIIAEVAFSLILLGRCADASDVQNLSRCSQIRTRGLVVVTLSDRQVSFERSESDLP